MNTIPPIDRLAAALARLPGIGRRSAERMAFRIAGNREGLAEELAAALGDVRDRVVTCSLCGVATLKAQDPCPTCADPRRDAKVLCVVENPLDILLLERAGSYRGRYHSLGGRISPMHGEGIEDLRVKSLLSRVDRDGIEEVILALGSDVEGEATASFLRHELASRRVRVTRLAFGIPAGSEIAYADPVTLSRAIENRHSM